MSRAPSAPEPYAARMARGVVAGTGGLAWNRLTGLLTVPLLVHSLGLPLYGVWAITDVIITSQSLVDLGALGAGAKFAAEAEALGDAAAMRRIVRLGLLWYTAIGLVVAAAIVVITPHAPGWLGISGDDASSARLLLLSASGVFTLSNYAYVFSSVLQGMQRLGTVHIGSGVSRVPFVAVIACTAAFGWRAAGAVAAITVMYVVQLVWFAAAARQHTRALSPSGTVNHPLGRLLSFGSQTYIASIADFAVLQVPKVVAAGFFGAEGAARIDLAYRIPLVAVSMTAPLVTTIIPAASRLAVQNRFAELPQLAARATRYLSVTATPLLLGCLLVGPQLLVTWVGHAADGLDIPLRFAAAGLFVQAISAGVTNVLVGMGRPGRVVRYKLVLIASSGALMVAGGTWHGLSGIAAGAALGFVPASVYLLAGSARHVGLATVTTTVRASTGVAIALAAAALTTAGCLFAGLDHDATLWAVAAASIAVFATLVVSTHAVGSEELAMIRSVATLRGVQRAPEAH